MVKWSVEHKKYCYAFDSCNIDCRILLYGNMERQENPTVASPIATISCIYGGASPEDIEN